MGLDIRTPIGLMFAILGAVLVDHRSDLWSIGVILYRLLTGNLPFPGKNAGDVMVRICTDPVQPPSWVVPGLPLEIDAFFLRALARDETERFQSAQELAEAWSAIATEASQVASQPANPQPPWQNKTVPIVYGGAPAPSPAALAAAQPFPPSQRAMPMGTGSSQSAVPPMPDTGSGTIRVAISSSADRSSSAAAPMSKGRTLWLVWAAVIATAVGGIAIGAVFLGGTSESVEAETKADSAIDSPPVPAVSTPVIQLAAPADSAAEPTPSASASPSAKPAGTAGARVAPAATSPEGSALPAAPKAPPKTITPNPLDIPD